MIFSWALMILACGNKEAKSTREEESKTQHGLSDQEAAQVLAKVGDRVITVGEFVEAVSSRGPFLRARYNSLERKRELLDQMVRFELFAQEAIRKGYDQLPEVQRVRKQALIRKFLKQEVEDRIRIDDISDDEVRAYYEAHKDEYNQPEQVRVSHILIADRNTAQRVLRQALVTAGDMKAFRQLAEQYNADPQSRDRFGDLGFFSRPSERRPNEPEVPKELAEVAFSMTKIGEIYPQLVRSSQGYHIVRLTGRRGPLQRTLEEAARSIRHRLWREKRERAVEELVQKLRAEADVVEHLELLSEVKFDLPEGDYPGLRRDEIIGGNPSKK
ncbi:MAG: peptidyl-prolyl cis-trans isomerase [Sandaracinaceae bacterium]|nr:peptidyl-prolyl cis-trans isomerase [Sandaracinaceae bacterium]